MYEDYESLSFRFAQQLPLHKGAFENRALTLCLKTSYNTPKPTPRRPRRKDTRHEKTYFSSSDIRAALRASHRLRRTGAAGADGYPRADGCAHGDAGADAHAHARTDRNAGTHARAGRGGDHGRRLPLGQYRRLHADPPRRRPHLPHRLPRREHAAHFLRNAHRRALSLLVYPVRSTHGPYRRGGRPRRRVPAFCTSISRCRRR